MKTSEENVMEQHRILIIDDEMLISWSLSTMLTKQGYSVETAASGTEAREKMVRFKPEMVLLDLWLPDISGLDLLRQFKTEDDDLSIIVMTANADADSAVKALKLGADDFIGKPFNLEAFQHLINKAFEHRHLRENLDFFREEIRKKSGVDKLVGTSGAMVALFKMIKACSDTDAKTVLILGESGTGKELVARAIHFYSARAEAPFIEINCAAIPENLLESELFGHEKGAYTDAGRRRKGIFEMAEGGTVFLDEIGDMPLSMQSKVLKVIETRRFRRLGSEEDFQANVRIIAATHQDLPEMVKDRSFRGDLFYRLNVMSIGLPPLRERKEDIAPLVKYFIVRLNEEYGRKVENISEEALACLTKYDWPGNVRELRNAIERSMMLEQSKTISSRYFNAEIMKDSSQERKGGANGAHVQPIKVETSQDSVSITDMERHMIQKGLELSGGNQTKAAKYLCISRDTLRYRMKKLGLHEERKTA